MPRTLSFPPPSSTTCPICAAGLSEARCRACGAVFASADGATLWRIDGDLHDLCRMRNDVVRRLLATADKRAAEQGIPGTAEAVVPELEDVLDEDTALHD